jgi:threonine dehydrogenase-like Zn-dependent dehydrogenase
MCIVAARMAGASSVIATGASSDALRLSAARIAGADHVINVDKEDVVQRVKEITSGWGARVVMDATAATGAVQRAFDLVMFGGTILLAGYKNGAPTQIVTDNIVLNALTVRGGLGSTEESMKTAVKYLNEGRVPTKELLGEVLSLDQFDEALLLLKRQHPKREAIRVTIKYS